MFHVVQIRLRQHCTRKLSIYVILVLSVQTYFCRKITFAMLSWSARANMAQEQLPAQCRQCLASVHSLVNAF